MPIPETDPLYATFGRAIRFHYCRMQMLLQELGVYPGQPPLLFVLGKHGPMSQRALAARLHLAPATVTVMLRRMERAGLVTRRGDPADHRISTVHLTARGRAQRDRVKRSLRTIAADCFDDFTPAQRRQLRGLLERLQANLERACRRIERQRAGGTNA
ncbi:MAG TPA: MarR family winged helix-turn-helix transcriptional regulator [Candidatus Edwardsbacteria bacterium]|nr:MarR family winged helix-turn-helix transcriptional regulator [Candidatus Edwardsbacteria bacterium]